MRKQATALSILKTLPKRNSIFCTAIMKNLQILQKKIRTYILLIPLMQHSATKIVNSNSSRNTTTNGCKSKINHRKFSIHQIRFLSLPYLLWVNRSGIEIFNFGLLLLLMILTAFIEKQIFLYFSSSYSSLFCCRVLKIKLF